MADAILAGEAAVSTASPAIQTSELVKQYGRITALAGMSMTVPRGEIFGFLGPNGAGKTTAVKLLLGLTRPTSGQANVLGRPAGDRATREHIGYLPELFRYQGWLTATEVLEYHCELSYMPRERRGAEIADALETVGLSTRAGDRVETFSKGMQQRLGLGVALLGKPDLIFLDEPTSALDPIGRHDVREIIRGIKARGASVFLNSHLLSEVELVCDRVAVVDHGRVLALGPIQEILGIANRVRLRVTGLPPNGVARLRQFGEIEDQGDWLVVRGIAEGAVPDIVAEAVRLGGRIHAVEPAQQTLEDRFLQLLGGAT
jgi:ABC-2 type transport system ATP-binding protein